jgi:hypothetical protein
LHHHYQHPIGYSPTRKPHIGLIWDLILGRCIFRVIANERNFYDPEEQVISAYFSKAA